MVMDIKTITMTTYQTSDGKVFENIKSAELWEQVLTKRKVFFSRFQIKEFLYAFWKPEPIYWLYITNIDEDKNYIESNFKITTGLENMELGWNIVTLLGSEDIQFFKRNEIISMANDISEHLLK
jgi:hypothetical protein